VEAAKESGFLDADESITSEIFEEQSENCLSIVVERSKVQTYNEMHSSIISRLAGVGAVLSVHQ